MQSSNSLPYLNYNVGEFVEFLVDKMLKNRCISLQGMIGEIYPDFNGVGVSDNAVMVVPVGASHPYSYPADFFGKPHTSVSKEEICNSFILWENRFEVLQARIGWTGFVELDNKILEGWRVKTELANTAKLVAQDLERGSTIDGYQSHLRRIEKILYTFRYHPNSNIPIGLSNLLQNKQLPKEHIIETLWGAAYWGTMPESYSFKELHEFITSTSESVIAQKDS